MGQENSSVVTDDAAVRRHFLMTDIVFERTDGVENSGPPPSLGALWVSKGPYLSEAEIFAVVSTSSWRWEVTGFIEITPEVDFIDCMVQNDAEEDAGFIHLDMEEVRSARLHSPNDLGQKLQLFDAEIELTMTWKEVEVSSESIQVADGRPDELEERGIERAGAYQRTRNLSDLDDAISMLKEAVDLTPRDDVGLPGRLSNLGITLRLRFERTGNLSDITEAISAQQKAADLTPKDHPHLPLHLTNIGASLLRRSERTGELLDVTTAISLQRRATELTPQHDPNLPGHLTNLGASLFRLFERTGELSDISEAISTQRKAVDLTPQGHVNLPAALTNLGASLILRYERIGELSDIIDAISVQQKAVDLSPSGHVALPSRLSNLGVSHRWLSERTGNLSDIGDAIAVQQKAVDITPHGHPDMPSRLGNLGASLTRRFERAGELSDISDAISIQQRAVELTPQGHSDLPGHLFNLGAAFTLRFKRTGTLSDITSAISAHQKAVGLTPEDHAALPARLGNLVGSFTFRFEHTGELSDIADAIGVQQKLVEITPEGHADLSSRLNNLGVSLTCRFERTGDLPDLSDAIAAQQRAVDLTPQDHAKLSHRLNNLGISLARRFERGGELADLNNAIEVQKKAVKTTPDGHPNLPALLTNLGIMFARRFEQLEELTDIVEAIAFQQKAVNLTPQDHAGQPSRLNNLGISFTRRFERTGELTDIGEAIRLHQKAVEQTSEGHATLPDHLYNLGASLYQRFTLSGDNGDLKDTLSHYKAAARSRIGSLRVKLNAAKHWASILIRHYPESPEIILAFDTALGLVTLIAGLEQTVRGRYTQLESTSGLALEAAAAAFALGKPDKALEWLEQGRCLVWSQLNNLRTPLDDLGIHDKILAQDIATVSKKLEYAGSSRLQSDVDMSLSEKIPLEAEAREHLALASRWDELIEKARAIPGFERFLMPLSCSQIIQHLPDSGPIVIINVDERRCDAIALLAGLDEPLHIPLPNFSLEKCGEYRTGLMSGLYRQHLRVRELEPVKENPLVGEERGMRPAPIKKRDKDESPVHLILRSLWEEVVKPILDGLGIYSTSRTSGEELGRLQELGRLWWCPTGALSFLPLHAAGIYRGPETMGVADYTVSSYTPTISAITDRVRNHRAANGVKTSGPGLFLTSQPSPSGASAIHGTTQEVRSIMKMAEAKGVRALALEGDELAIDACLERMQEFGSIHLACHGSQNAAEPLQSRFLFHRGSLELGTILKSDLRNADLAFLSACQTSTGEEKLSDEAVHLAAGMLAAGYRRVVGTMWSIGDKAAQDVATSFYEYLFTHKDEDSGTTFDGTLSAVALHHATQELRLVLDDTERSLLTWIPFVHFGL
ncbi:hypothetical protein D9611_013394 [Ephemerocybe angulata]|uniref:CHAT domain-containing protein n=1 Tax=Ephemerocybe angulata TaxID=980116 RepID=A0A8H5BV58_9AGAR|nr:hypothetical protein D9611_013394 [Tulosesus angulatus]